MSDTAETPKTEPVQKPSVGRIVHYRPAFDDKMNSETKSQPYPAIITHVWGDECVNLSVFQDGSYPLAGSSLAQTSVSKGEGDRSWSWPPRV